VSLLTILAASILPTTQCTASSTFTTTTNNNNIEKNDHRHRYTQTTTTAFQFPNLQQLTQSLTNPKSATPTTTSIQQEDELLNAITESGSTKRLDNSQNIQTLIEQLEASPSIPRPGIASEIMGRWRLLYTTNVETVSLIQRKAADATKFNIYQDITLRDNEDNDEDPTLIVSQVVKFSPPFELVVDALASTSFYPLPELSDRQTDGTILGLNILGVSTIGKDAAEDDTRPDARINFVFDEGNFELGNEGGFKMPYPVPFRSQLFREAVKGWIDVTYLSERVRVSRGNKGTTFVLVKEEEEDVTS